jgi:UDP-N-acetylglucosamine--N-acetylmuramyl-(pentapeptide) pyrophosphoryl-undecaprenol N-acetylglucosamine transferase
MSRGLVMIMAGGTGGHIYPGLAVASALQASGIKVRWLGAAGGMELEKVPAHDIGIDAVRISALRGKGLMRWLSLPFRLLRAVLDARQVMRVHAPDCAVSFGGYVAGPGGIAAWLRGVPLVVHEQNRIPGMTNRVLARFAKQVMQAFPDTFKPRVGAVSCGNPVRSEVVALDPPDTRWQERSGPPRLLVTGGSQGARSLNQTLPDALALIGGGRLQVRHQSGKTDVEATRKRYALAGLEATVSPFIDDMAAAYAWADVVVCRAGALTVSELAAAGCGAVLVPFPHAVDDHQTGNAQFLVEAGAAVVLQETELTPASLAQVLGPILDNRENSLRMARAARSVASPDAAEAVARACLQWVPA